MNKINKEKLVNNLVKKVIFRVNKWIKIFMNSILAPQFLIIKNHLNLNQQFHNLFNERLLKKKKLWMICFKNLMTSKIQFQIELSQLRVFIMKQFKQIKKIFVKYNH